MRIVILTTFELDEYVFEALRAGASGFLVKDTEPVELLRGVRAVAGGDALLSPGVTRRLIEEFASRAAAAAARRRARRAHRPRARGAGPRRRRASPTTRSPGTAVRQPGDRQDPRQPGHDQARRADRAQLVVSPTSPAWSGPAGSE